MGNLNANTFHIKKNKHGSQQSHVPKYDDFVVEPTYSYSIPETIPLLLHSIMPNAIIPSVIVSLIIQYYPYYASYLIHKVTRDGFAKGKESSAILHESASNYCSYHPSGFFISQNRELVRNYKNELCDLSGTIGIECKDNDGIDIVSNGLCAHDLFIISKKKRKVYFVNSGKAHEKPRMTSFFNSTNALQITKVVCGRDHYCFLCKHGWVYSFGGNLYGQLGRPFTSEQYFKDCIVKIKGFVTDIACGAAFNICLDRKHRVWCFGENGGGYLGLDHYKDVDIAMKHPFFTNNKIRIKQIACGSRHCMFITLGNDCYMCGSNSNGQCDYSESELRNAYPNPHLFENKVIKGWCGDNHTVLLTIDNELISVGSLRMNWNRNENGIENFKEKQSIVGVIPGHHCTYLVVDNI